MIENREYFPDGVGLMLIDGKRPFGYDDAYETNEHVNVIFNIYDTEAEYEHEVG